MAEPLNAEELADLRSDLRAARLGLPDGPLAGAFDKVARLLATLDQLTTPTRFDPDDRSTWPEPGDVLAYFDGEWRVAWLDPAHRPVWIEPRNDDSIVGTAVEAGDLGMLLPPTPEAER